MDKIVIGSPYGLSNELLGLLLEYCVLQLGGQVVLTAGDLAATSQQYELRITSNVTQHEVTLTLLTR